VSILRSLSLAIFAAISLEACTIAKPVERSNTHSVKLVGHPSRTIIAARSLFSESYIRTERLGGGSIVTFWLDAGNSTFVDFDKAKWPAQSPVDIAIEPVGINWINDAIILKKPSRLNLYKRSTKPIYGLNRAEVDNLTIHSQNFILYDNKIPIEIVIECEIDNIPKYRQCTMTHLFVNKGISLTIAIPIEQLKNWQKFDSAAQSAIKNQISVKN
jgi:hypothetical protein